MLLSWAITIHSCQFNLCYVYHGFNNPLQHDNIDLFFCTKRSYYEKSSQQIRTCQMFILFYVHDSVSYVHKCLMVMESIYFHDDVIKWKHFPRYWPFVRGIHRLPMNSPHESQWRGALMFSLICAWIYSWVNNREAGDLRHHRAHYDVMVIRRESVSSSSLKRYHV